MIVAIDDIKDGKEWALSHNFPFFATSAATGENINQLFELVASLCAKSTGEEQLENATRKTNEKGCC